MFIFSQPLNVLLALSGLLITAFHLNGALAQTDETAQCHVLEEIVVTAQKLEENLREVPITMQAFTDENLETFTVRHLGDLETFVPGLTVNSFTTTQPVFSIRGIGHSDFSIGTDSPVGIYLDGVYTGRSGSALMNLMDIERIEVLKGPQGALFGRSATAGAINVITKKPVAHTEGAILLRYGNYNKRRVESVLNVPVLDTLFFRANALYNARDGFYENEAGGDDLETEGNKTLRGALLWTPGHSTRILFSADYDDTAHDGSHTISLNPALSVGKGDPFGAVANDVEESKETRILRGYTLNGSHAFDPFTLHVITAYREFDTENREDSDGLADVEHYLDTHNIEKNRQFYQELRLDGKFERYQFFLGASFLRESARQTHRVTITTDTINWVVGNPLLPTGSYWQENMENQGEYDGFSLFSDLTWHLTDKLDATIGLRYNRDDKKFQWVGKPNSLGLPFDFIFPLGPNDLVVCRENTWDQWSMRLVLDYDVSPDVFVYAAVATGYKAGGFGGLEINSEYDPETVINYEIGAKSLWLDHTLQANVAGFYYKYKDRQFMNCVANSGVPDFVFFLPVNGHMKGMGGELEISWQATGGLTLMLNAGYSDIRWDDYTTLEGIEQDGNPTGEPPFRVVTGLDYKTVPKNHGVFKFHMDHSYTRYKPKQIDGHSRAAINARLTWVMIKNRGKLSLWAKNLFDEKSISRENDAWQTTLGTTFVARRDPRTFGIDYRYQF